MLIIQSKIVDFYQKWVNLYRKLSNLIEEVKNSDLNRQFLIKFDDFRYKFEYKIVFGHGIRISDSNLSSTSNQNCRDDRSDGCIRIEKVD